MFIFTQILSTEGNLVSEIGKMALLIDFDMLATESVPCSCTFLIGSNVSSMRFNDWNFRSILFLDDSSKLVEFRLIFFFF